MNVLEVVLQIVLDDMPVMSCMTYRGIVRRDVDISFGQLGMNVLGVMQYIVLEDMHDISRMTCRGSLLDKVL